MKNLESLQLTELDAREIREVDGGFNFFGLGQDVGKATGFAVGYLTGLLIETVDLAVRILD